MYKVLVLLSLFTLASCSRGYVYPTNIKKAEEICKDKGGLHHIEVNTAGNGAYDDAKGDGRFAVCNQKDASIEEDLKFELK